MNYPLPKKLELLQVGKNTTPKMSTSQEPEEAVVTLRVPFLGWASKGTPKENHDVFGGVVPQKETPSNSQVLSTP